MVRTRSVGSKLTLAFGLVSILFLGAVLVAEFSYWRAFRRSREAYERSLPVLIDTERVVSEVREVLERTTRAVLGDAPEDLAREQVLLGERLNELESEVAELGRSDPGSTHLGTRLAGLRAVVEELFDVRMELVRQEEALELGLATAIEAADAIVRESERELILSSEVADDGVVANLQELRFLARSFGNVLRPLREATSQEGITGLRSAWQADLQDVAWRLARIRATLRNDRLVRAVQDLLQATTGRADLFELAIARSRALERFRELSRLDDQYATDLGIALDALVYAQRRSALEAHATSEVGLERARTVVRGLGLVATLLALGVLVVYVRGDVVRRLANLIAELRALSRGELERPLTREGDDELSDLTEAAEVFRENAVQLAKRTEELHKRNQDLDAFAHVASHDMKSPLRAIDNLSSWVLEDCEGLLPSASQEHLEELRRRAKRLEVMLEELLEFARLGTADSPRVAIDLRSLVHDLLELHRHQDKCFGFTVNGDAQGMTWRSPLVLSLRNLIANAIRHHDREQGHIEVSFRRLDEEQVEILVCDDGPGIPEAHREEVFQMFKRLRGEDGGTGMGLALVRSAAESVGGSVRIVPRANGMRGTCFVLSWPLRRTLQAA